MGEVIAFPAPNERDWKLIEATLRSARASADQSIWDECIPELREQWKDVFRSFSVSVPIDVGFELTDSQLAGVRRAIDRVVASVADEFKEERGRNFGIIASLLYENAELRRSHRK